MPLVKCPECQNNVSDKAKTCPKCGHPMGEKINIVVGAPERPINETTVNINQGGTGLICPKCKSTNIHIDKKGYSAGKGCCGFLTCGPLGFLCGQDGANRLRKTCINCNKTWD